MDMPDVRWSKAIDEWIGTGDKAAARSLRKRGVRPDAESYERLAEIALGETMPAKRLKAGKPKLATTDNNNGAVLGLVMGFLKNYKGLLEARVNRLSDPGGDWDAVIRALEPRAAKSITEAMRMTENWFANNPFHQDFPVVTSSKIKKIMYEWLHDHQQGLRLRDAKIDEVLIWWESKELKRQEIYEERQKLMYEERNAILVILNFFCAE